MTSTDQLIAQLAAQPAVAPARSPWRIAARWLAATLAYVALLVAIAGTRPDLMLKFQSPLFMGEIALLVAIILFSSLSAALLAFPDGHQHRALAAAPLVFFLAFIGLMLAALQRDAGPSPHGVECLACISFYSLFPALWMFWQVRRLATTQRKRSGAIVAVTAFSIGALALRLCEPTDNIAHVVLWHYLPMIGAAVLGAAIGQRLLKW